MYENMNDKVAIVTGGGSGIGRETARMFAREGVKVVVADWSEEGGQETVSIIESAGGQASYCNVDVSNEAMVKAMVRFAVSRYGRNGQAHEVGAAVLWLCSSAASLMNGAAIAVDGGLSAQ